MARRRWLRRLKASYAGQKKFDRRRGQIFSFINNNLGELLGGLIDGVQRLIVLVHGSGLAPASLDTRIDLR